MPLFSLFLFEKFFLFKTPSPHKHLDSHTVQPSLILSQESCSRPCTWARGFSCPGLRTGPRGLIVLKHSSYRLSFQCRLQFLFSDVHICWNTIGCSLCSSDQLGVSLVLRGSGLSSHLSRRHLPPIINILMGPLLSVLQKTWPPSAKWPTSVVHVDWL